MGNQQYNEVKYANYVGVSEEESKELGCTRVLRHPNIADGDELVSNYDIDKDTGEKR